MTGKRGAGLPLASRRNFGPQRIRCAATWTPRTTNTSASASSSSNTTFLNGLALQKFPANGDESLPVIKIAQLRAGNSDGADRASYNVPGEYVIEDGDVLFSWSGSLEVGGCLHLFEPKLGPECRSVRRI